MIFYLLMFLLISNLVHVSLLKSSSPYINMMSLMWFCGIFLNSVILNFSIMFTGHEMNYFTMGNFNINPLSLGVDSLSVYFMLLSNILVMVCSMVSWNSIKFMVKEFNQCLTLMNFLLVMMFSSVDLLAFYVSFELILLPVFMMMSVWGSSEQSFKASYYFFLYTLTGSLAMLMGLVKVYSITGSMSLVCLYMSAVEYQKLMVMGFLLSLAVKIPMFPVHLWLPQAHVEAPVAGSVLLAGMLLKLGGYGFISFMMPVFPEGSKFVTPLVITFSVMAVMYAGVLTIKQTDFKSLVAYSSVSHMGLVTMGIFSFSMEGFLASTLMMFAHGVVSSGLFIAVNCLYESSHSSIMSVYKGMATMTPLFSILFFLLTLANISAPGSLNFWGELLSFFSFYCNTGNIFLTVIMLTSVVMSAAYSMNLFTSVFWGNNSVMNFTLSEINKKEFMVLLMLSLSSWVMGVYPNYISGKLLLNFFNILVF